MAWIEVHTVLSRHRKVKELAISLGIKSVHAKSHLISLWLAALEQQEDGDLRKWSDQFLSEAAEWDGDPGQFRAALEQHGWLDNGLIHDWLDYAGRFLMNKYASSNVPRLREIWGIHSRRYGRATGKQPKRNQSKTTPNHTLPNQPNQPNHTYKRKFDFESVWKDYPRKLGKDDALRHFQAQVKNPEDYVNIQKAVVNFNADLRKKQTAEEYIPHGSTWFNKRWRDWITYNGAQLPPAPRTPPIFKKPEILPPDPTAAEIKEMHDEKVKKLGVCRLTECAFCATWVANAQA